MSIWKLQELYQAHTLAGLDDTRLLAAQTTCISWHEFLVGRGIPAATTTLQDKGISTLLIIPWEQLSAMIELIDNQVQTRYGCND